MHHRKLVVVLAVAGLIFAACGDDDATSTTTTSTTTTASTAPTQTTDPTTTKASTLDLPVAAIETSTGGVTGRFFQVRLGDSNALPCGLLLVPEDPGLQRMMVVEQTTASSGGTYEPFVVCIDSDLAGADPGSVYQVGTIAEGDLLALAECICDRGVDELTEDSLFGDLDLQLAVWSVADGTPPTALADLIADAEGVLGDSLGAFDFGGMGDMEGVPDLDEALGFITENLQGASNILAECGIEIAGE